MQRSQITKGKLQCKEMQWGSFGRVGTMHCSSAADNGAGAYTKGECVVVVGIFNPECAQPVRIKSVSPSLDTGNTEV